MHVDEIKKLSGPDLMREYRTAQLMMHNPMLKGKEKGEAETRFFIADTEVVRRLGTLDEAREDMRVETVQRFAHSAATVVTNLWAAHGGREMKEHESEQFARTLFEFFKELSKT